MTTALVPVEMYDVQVLNLIRDIERKQKPTPVDPVQAIKARIHILSIERAINILSLLGYANDTFHLDQNKWLASDFKDERYFPDCQGRMASETPVIWFWGGPPNRLKWYKGTLQTLLEDRILYEINENGAEVMAKRLGL